MTEEQARALCTRLSQTHEDRETHQFLPRRRPDSPDDQWEVVKVALPPPVDNLGTEIRADERPDTPGDPRSPQQRDVPYGGA